MRYGRSLEIEGLRARLSIVEQLHREAVLASSSQQERIDELEHLFAQAKAQIRMLLADHSDDVVHFTEVL